MSTSFKAGFAVMIGRSNVGKSTLLNNLVGSKVAITSPKAQTTRLPIQGILTRAEGQIIFVDTPGVFHHRDALTKTLLQAIRHSLEDIDVVIYVADPTREIGEEEKAALHLLDDLTIPKILVLNKSDLHNRQFIDSYRALSENFNLTIDVSAETGHNTNRLIDAVFGYLPAGQAFYPEEQKTNLSRQNWIAELIREKLFLRLRQEVPYQTHVEVDEIEERNNGMLYIHARILTNADRTKKMIIGKGGQGVKEVGQATRRELETVMNRKIFLDLNVEVDKHWVSRLT